jgi:protein SCO1/2
VLAKGLKAFEASDAARAARVQPIFITVDPERDNPAALKQWVQAFHPRLIGLTGTPAQIDQVRKEYGIYAKRAEGGDKANYLVDHFAVYYLFGPDGQPVAFAPHGATPQDITTMLATYVR